MDCTAEEHLVRMRLDGLDGVRRLVFDLSVRRLDVYHTGDRTPLTAALDDLGLGARHVATKAVEGIPLGANEDATEERTPLLLALAINAVFFVGELTAGLLAGSMGLVADSLDMLADALVYALSLAAVGGTVLRKKRLARTSGYLQLGLAVFGLVEVVRRFVVGEAAPDVTTMVVVAALALVGNVATLLILSKAQRGEAHVEASWIFTSNDIKVNGLVIVSALVVWATSSGIPDLLAGAFIFLIVANGARQILALSK
ncbi:MAG: cation transporter [Rhodothermaceae bacterium]|nr:cation transporter [Rhodothermaceae bacterium]